MYKKYKDCNIAGVTFNNDPCDGGESRQDLLKAFLHRPSVVRLVKTIFHNNETGYDELAIKVISYENNKVLGYIPRTHIEEFANIPIMILRVSYYKNQYSGSLTLPVAPSAKQYSTMKAMLWKKKIDKLPVYDKYIYQYVIANN
jgi:hypothetical protein